MLSQVIIGGGFGDEGKGLMTDYLAQQGSGDIVVRFNGGAQAGHTVSRYNLRHVFSHVGSGAIMNLPTYLSEHFIVNPILLRKEVTRLNKVNGYNPIAKQPYNIQPRMFVHPDALISTPYDMLINQIVENHRTQRHGSCGIGVNETVTRSLAGFPIRFGKLFGLRKELERIHKEWVPKRIQYFQSVGTNLVLTPQEQDHLNNPTIIDNYLDDLKWMWENVEIQDYSALHGKNPIFEGAQGLQLSEDNKVNFPHVTRSYTGLKNVKEILAHLPEHQVNVTYMSRCYQTRHGAGPFPGEASVTQMAQNFNIVDQTNIPNEFQGSLRLAPFDANVFFGLVWDDLAKNPIPGINVNLGITCLDQITTDSIRFNVLDSVMAKSEAFGINSIWGSWAADGSKMELVK